MTLNFDPFELVAHNSFEPFGIRRLPRFVFHLAHVALGLPGFALHRWAHVPYLAAALLTLALSIAVKFAWFRWRRRVILHSVEWHAFGSHDPADLLSDAGLAQLGCAVGVVLFAGGWVTVGWLVDFYIFETFNGT